MGRHKTTSRGLPEERNKRTNRPKAGGGGEPQLTVTGWCRKVVSNIFLESPSTFYNHLANQLPNRTTPVTLGSVPFTLPGFEASTC